MKKIFLILFILVTLSCIFAAEPIAYLMQGRGNVQIIRDEKVVKFKNGELLYNNDEIKTGGESFAAIKYVDGGAAIKVFPNSVIRISAVKYNKQLNKNTILQSGNVYSKISTKIKGAYQVETPTTVASVKGTGFVTKIDEDKKTIIIVLEGEVLVQNKDSGQSKSVQPGSTSVSDTDGNVSSGDTQPGEISEADMKEIESINKESEMTIKVQITDDNGNIKYIEITR